MKAKKMDENLHEYDCGGKGEQWKDEGEVVKKKKKKTDLKHETQTYDSPVSLKNTGSFLLIRHIHNTQIYAQTQAEAATLLVWTVILKGQFTHK